SISSLIAEMHKPRLPGLGLHHAALVRSVDIGIALVHHDLLFIWSHRFLRTHSQLPAKLNATGRRQDVVIIVPLIEFRTFYGWMIIVPVKGQYRFSDQLRAVGGHLLGHQQAVDTSP